LSDDEENDDFDDENQLPELAGTLCKWTNYIHGWQDRYFVLKDGALSYYKSENETGFGCRGAVSLSKVGLSPHEFDDCRFDVGVNDCVWYLRARSSEERSHWINAIDIHRQADSGYGSENNLRRQGSMLSLTSAASLSTASTSSFKRGRGLKEKLAEMETFRDILCRQVDTLQNYFDACTSALAHQTIHDPHAIDFKGESYTFKATTAGILATLSHCIELMSQREEAWRRRLEREVEKRRKVEEAYKHTLAERPKPIVLGGPDYEEGPHSMLHEDEFYDAIDAALDKMEKEEEKKISSQSSPDCAAPKPRALSSTEPDYKLKSEIESMMEEHISLADMTGSDMAGAWMLIAEDGDMKVFKREQEEDGMVIDPIKAIHTVKGITGHELCHHFWNPEVRMEWETTLDSSTVVEWLNKDSMITYQVHKRVWPATQRDSLFWSTIRHCPSEDDEGPDYWIVVNNSTEHEDCPLKDKQVRIRFNVAMICQTVVQPPESGKDIDRSDLTCKIQYSAQVNPGGWAPASVIRVISKREVPKFLKNFTSYVINKTKDKPIMF
ncbi:hypothetical protein CAPTEDRAFT_22682, partial [Capitella teleta]